MKHHLIEAIQDSSLNESPEIVNQLAEVKIAEMGLRYANMRFYHAAREGDVKHLDDLYCQAEMAGLQMIDALNVAGKV